MPSTLLEPENSTLLQPEDRQAIVSVIAGLYSFSPRAQDRRTLLEQAHLEKEAAGINLDGPALSVAANLVNSLEKYVTVTNIPKYQPLGALLTYILTLTVLSLEEAQIVAELINKYSLVNDRKYINKLREQYGLKPPTPEMSGAEDLPFDVGPARLSSNQDMKLTGRLRKQLQDALMSAFPSLSELASMTFSALDVDLEQIYSSGSLAEAVFILIEWAEGNGRMEELIRGALSTDPNNPTLRAFGEQVLSDGSE